MISEVNNIFDEGRMYFLPFNMNQQDNPNDNDHQALDGNILDLSCSPRIFKHTWPKDSHVSPFSSRKGFYILSACDPSMWQLVVGTGERRPFIDIKPSLLSSKKRPKMTARLWSTSAPLDPTTLSILDTIILLFSWCWVGLMTCE